MDNQFGLIPRLETLRQCHVHCEMPAGLPPRDSDGVTSVATLTRTPWRQLALAGPILASHTLRAHDMCLIVEEIARVESMAGGRGERAKRTELSSVALRDRSCRVPKRGIYRCKKTAQDAYRLRQAAIARVLPVALT